jgi:hypothetical protein
MYRCRALVKSRTQATIVRVVPFLQGLLRHWLSGLRQLVAQLLCQCFLYRTLNRPASSLSFLSFAPPVEAGVWLFRKVISETRGQRLFLLVQGSYSQWSQISSCIHDR